MEKKDIFYSKDIIGRMNINTDKIPEVTAGLFWWFAEFTFIKKFTLVGGTEFALKKK